jgi:hypothetical protein
MDEDHEVSSSSSSSFSEVNTEKETPKEENDIQRGETVTFSSKAEEPCFSQPPQKRPVGRPRKHPLPPNYIPPPSTRSSRPPPQQRVQNSSLYDELESQGISAKDIQKYLLKKKVKKYVQQYVHKYQNPVPPISYHNNNDDHMIDEEDFQEIEESTDEEEGEDNNRTPVPSSKQQTEADGSNRQQGHSKNQKLNQMMGLSNKRYSQPRYNGYRF